MKIFYEREFCCKISIAVEEPSPLFRNLQEHLHIFSKFIFISFKKSVFTFTNFIKRYPHPYLFILLPKRDCPLNLFMQQDRKSNIFLKLFRKICFFKIYQLARRRETVWGTDFAKSGEPPLLAKKHPHLKGARQLSGNP